MSDNDTNSGLSTWDTLVLIFTFLACAAVLICWYMFKYLCTRKKNQSPSGMDNTRQAFRNRGNTEPRDHPTLVSQNRGPDFQITNTTNSSTETVNIAPSSNIEIHEPQQHFFIEGTGSRLVQPLPTRIEPSCPHEKPPPSYEDACKYYVDK